MTAGSSATEPDANSCPTMGTELPLPSAFAKHANMACDVSAASVMAPCNVLEGTSVQAFGIVIVCRSRGAGPPAVLLNKNSSICTPTTVVAVLDVAPEPMRRARVEPNVNGRLRDEVVAVGERVRVFVCEAV